MKFIADLHIHSRFSRATAKNLDVENLYISAQKKGISVIATGDFTHPGWFEELRDKLAPAEPGLLRLKKEIAADCDRRVPGACRGKVRFVLAAEISNIYKKAGKTRKNHNLIFVPDLDTAGQISAKLDRIGNIRSDGRPILGLDARDLLEILLETSEEGFLIPAHIWTPWFSVLGSKSGFDSIEECFEELTPYIFAVETGLSSDPAMNRRVSGLDRYTLVSNSDAHSPAKLGREANLFDADLSYNAIRSALKGTDSNGFKGTFEFYPEEGKYHADGHRTCKVSLLPHQTIENGGVCPVCGKALTLGVLYRVEELADRPPGYRIEGAPPFYNLIPLDEVLAEIFGVGPSSKRVRNAYEGLLQKIGTEFSILHFLDEAILDRAGIPLLAEAIRRMRQKKIWLSPGYDGEFGKIKIFDAHKRELLLDQKPLFNLAAPKGRIRSESPAMYRKPGETATENPGLPDMPWGKEKFTSAVSFAPREQTALFQNPPPHTAYGDLNPEQLAAVHYDGGPLLILAGPGTGKTRTLTQRVAQLIRVGGVLPENILAITFTNKAAGEMLSRLTGLLGADTSLPQVATFHGFCLGLLKTETDWNCQVVDDDSRRALLAEAVAQADPSGGSGKISPQKILNGIVSAKQLILGPDDPLDPVCPASEQKELAAVYRLYQQWMAIENICDYEDLIFKVVRLLEGNPGFAERCRRRFTHLFVDEYQDLNHGQYRIIRALAKGRAFRLFVIGDPDQSIYGFRGSDSVYFKRFTQDFPNARILRLTRNYRSTRAILRASGQVIRRGKNRSHDIRVYGEDGEEQTIGFMELANERAEAVAIGKLIENMVGGLDFHALDAGLVNGSGSTPEKSFADVAVLYRTHSQAEVLARAFERAGIPYQAAAPISKGGGKGITGLLSLLRVLSGLGTYADMEAIRDLTAPRVGARTIKVFKSWGYRCGLTLKRALFQSARLPIPGMSTQRQKRLFRLASYLSALDRETKTLSLIDTLQFLAANTKLATYFKTEAESQHREFLKNLLALADDSGGDPGRFFSAVALQSETDAYDSRVQKVSLMTMHASKGLEFPVAIIAGCENDLIPYTRGKEAVDLDEERRLFYVAMTRAEERLYFTHAKKRTLFGRTVDRKVSPFVADIEKELIRRETAGRGKKKARCQVQLSLFK